MARTFNELMQQYDEQDAKKAEPPATAPAPAAPTATTAAIAAPPAPKLTKPVKSRKATIADSAQKAPAAATVPTVSAPFQINLPPELSREIDYREFYDNAGDDLNDAKRQTAERLGLTPDDFDRVVAIQGVDLEGINEDKKKGKTFDEVKRNNIERGVLGFLPQAARADAFQRSAKTVLDAQQGSAADNRMEIREAIDDEGFLGGYVAPGYKREFDSVSKPGEYGYLSSMLLVEALKKDPEASRIYDLYGRGLATGNSRQYVEERTKDLMKRAGVSASTPDAPDQLKRLKRRALREVLAYKTVGQWTPAITMQDVEATEDYKAPNMFAAIGPNVELIGFNNKGQAVYRQESPLSVAFRAIDLPQEAVVSMLEGRPVAEGVQSNANFFEAALEHTRDANGFVRVGAGLLGFAGAVLFPDLLWGLAMIPTAVRPVQSAMALRKHGAKAAELLEVASRAREANDFAKARAAESQLRELLPGIADKLDQTDAVAADVLKLVSPDTDVLNADMAALLASHSKEAELLGAERVFMHPSERKAVLSGKLDKRGVPLTAYSELYNTERHLKRIEEARAAFVQRMPKTMEEYASMYSRGVTRDVLARAVLDETISPKQADELADIVAKSAPRALTDMDAFSSELRTALKAHPEFSKPEYNLVRQSLHAPGASRLRSQLNRKLQELRDTNLEELTKSDLALFDRAKRAVEQNNQARALAAAIVRNEVAQVAKVKVQPLEVFGNVALKTPTGEPLDLSSGGVLFLRQMRDAFPDAPFNDIYAPTALVDQMMVNAAKKRKMDPLELYKQKLPEIRRAIGDEVARLGGKRGTPVVPVGASPTAAVAAAPTAAPVAVAAPVVATQAAQNVAARATQAATRAGLPAYVIGAAKRAAPTPLGWNIGDVALVKDGASLLERAFRGEIPYARFASPSTDGKAALSLSVGDVKIVAFAPDAATQMVGRQARQVYDTLVAVGDATPKMVRGAFDERSAVLRGMEEAEKMMAARVKKGEPAIKGAAISERARPAALPARVVDETEKTEFLLAPRRRPSTAPPEGLPVSVGPGPQRAVAEVTEQIPGREVTVADVLPVTEANITAPVARAFESAAEEVTQADDLARQAEKHFGSMNARLEREKLARGLGRSTAEVLARLSEQPGIEAKLESLRVAAGSGDPADFRAYEEAARRAVVSNSIGIWDLYRLAGQGADDAIDAIQELSLRISGLDTSVETQLAKAIRAAVAKGDDAAVKTLRAAKSFDAADFDELEEIRAAYAAEQAERAARRAARAAPEVFERAVEEAPAVARAEEAVSAAPAQPMRGAPAPAAPEAAPAMSRVEALRRAVETEERAVAAASGAVKARRAEQLKMLRSELASAEARAAKSAAPATTVAITAAPSAPVAAAEKSVDLASALKKMDRLRSPKGAEKFFREVEAGALAPAEKVQVYDALATKLEKLAAAEDATAQSALETLAATVREAEFKNRAAAERALRERLAAAETEPGVLKQVSAAGEVKGAVTLNEAGRNVIVLFDKADVSTVLHEVAHVLRRELIDAEDMNAITQWVRSRGVKVSHEFGEFVGDATEVEKAEELFAQAFETYVKSGKSPIPRLERVFAVLRTAMAHVYRDVVSPTIGEELEPEVRRVFDKLLEEVPEKQNPTLRQILVEQLTGNVSEADLGALDVLAREAARKGLPLSAPEDIQRQATTARKKQLEKADEIDKSYADRIRRAATPEEEWRLKNARDDARSAALSDDAVMVSFPVPVMGRKDWTGAQLAEMQIELDQQAARAIERGRGIRLALSPKSQRAGREVIEETPVENIRAALAQDDTDAAALARAKSAGRAVVGTFFGGDVVGEKGMRLLPPTLRKALETTSRVITHATGDVVGLLNDALVTGRKDELFRYLGGASDVRRRAGRPLLVAGHDYMGSVRQMFKRLIDGMGEEEKAALTQLCDALNKTGEARDRDVARLGFIPGTGNDFSKMDEARQATQTAAVKAVYRILYSQASNEDFGSTMATALRNAVGAPVVARPTHELRFVETISYLAGNTARNGELFAGDSAQAARILVNEAASIYKSEEAGRRVAVLIGGFGSADLGKKILARVDLAISPDAQRAFGKWLAGEQWDPRYTPEIQRIVDQYGFNPEFVGDQVLGMELYIPRKAREMMAEALARSTFKPAMATDAGDAIGFAYRYMKVRMTRGNWFLRQKYYMMNTLDHFMQMGMRNGFGVAAASTSRVLLQDVMVLPLWQQLVEVARKLPGGGRIPADVLERARAGLQSKGDALAHMMSVGKYRLEVNPILEGVEGVFFAGGKPYRNKDVRSIAVQEGVFSSYDMSQLSNAIQREGALFLRTAINGEMALDSATGSSRLRNFLADWQSTVSDTAEAWGERERLGAMVTLMEAGYDPRTAARLATDALYDYAGSMTKADRSLLVGIMFPFWAFQKNANTQIFNLLFSPAGAYRMMVLRRARERGADALTEILYNNVGNEYGVDVKSMPPELQESYYAIIKRFEESFDGKEPPPEAKRAMRLLLTGRGVGTEGGKYVETSGAIQELRNRGALADLARFAEFTVKRPSKSDRTSYLRERAAIAVPFPRTEAVRQYYSLVGPNHSYLELFFPESSIESGMRHITTVAAGYALMGAMPLDFLMGGKLKEGGMDEVRLNRLLQPIADPSRSPLLQPLLAGSMDELESRRKLAKPLAQTGEVVKKIHPFVAALIDDSFGTTLLRVPAKSDPFAVDTAKGEKFGLPAAEAERIRKLQETYPEAGKARDERAYLIGTAWVMAFDNSPLGELNAMLLRFEESPLESADPRGELLAWARGATGIEVQETSASETARREEPKKSQPTKGI